MTSLDSSGRVPSNHFEDWVHLKFQELEQKFDKLDKLAISNNKVADDSAGWQSTRGKTLDPASVSNNDEESSTFTLSEDVYMLLASSKCTSPSFWFSLLVIFVFQYTMLVVLIADRIDLESSNPLRLPANVETTVRLAQTLAIFIAIFTQNDLLIGMQTLFEGLPQACRGGDGSQRFKNMSAFQWYMACLYKTIQGALSLIAAFILIMQSETVFDVLLNFLGMSFVGDIDDQAFELAGLGYFGKSAKQTVQDIQETEFYRQKSGRKWVKRVSHIIASLFVLLAMLMGYLVLLSRQNSGVYSVQNIQVEFGDEVIPYLGLFSGCYEAKDVGGYGEGRLLYEQISAEKDGGKFGYCGSINGGVGGWTFFFGELRDPCDYLLRSGATGTFNVVGAGGTKWYTNDNRPLDLLEMNRVDSPLQECGRGVFETSRKDVCGRIEGLAEGSLEILPVDDLLDNRDFFDTTTSRPIYYSTTPNTMTNATDLVFFTGHRWVLTDTDLVIGLNTTENRIPTVGDLQGFFYGDQAGFQSRKQIGEWVNLVSERVEISSSRGSPLGLLWFYPRYEESRVVEFPAADATRPVTSPFSCGFCDDDSNPCLYEGKCNADSGLCNCTHGASGALCQDKPLGNGICNVYFNAEEFNYDGGDCCPGTCVGVTCGEDDLPSPFERQASGYFFLSVDETFENRQYPFGILPDSGEDLTSLPFWFEHCIDPRSAKVTLEVSPLNEVGYADFIPVTVRCDGILYFQAPEFGLITNDTFFRQELSIPYGSLCTFDFPMETDYADIFESISIIATDANEPLMYQINSRCSFEIQIPQSQCVWETLVSESIVITSDLDAACPSDISSNPSLSVVEFEGLGGGPTLDRICIRNPEHLLERYAIRKLLDITQDGGTVTSEQHICDGVWNTDDLEIDCDEKEHVVGIGLRNPVPKFLPSEVKFLGSLESIAVNSPSNANGIEILPTEIGSLSLLTNLEISYNALRQLPSEIGRLTNLGTLSIDNSMITELPAEFAELVALSNLILSSNKLTVLPTEIGNLSLLAFIMADYNQFVQVPSEIGQLSLLKDLDFEGNNLTQIPSEIGNCQSLLYLTLSSNQLNSVPSEIGNLTNLQNLYLDSNRLNSIPSTIGNLSSLGTLDLSKNNLSQLPDFSNFLSLVDLDVSYNTELLSKSPPDELYELFRLTDFFCTSNYDPEDTGIVRDWCRAILDGPSSAPSNGLEEDSFAAEQP